MVEKLADEVALEGGDQVSRDLTKLQQGFAKTGDAIRDFAATFAEIGAAAGVAAIAAAGAALVKFGNAAEETSKQLTELQKATGVAIGNLSALQQVFAAGGTNLKRFTADFARLNEQIDTAGQARAIRNAGPEYAKWANSIDSVRQQFDNLASGARVTFSALTTLQTKVQALKESLAEVSDPQARLEKLADVFKNLAAQGAQGVAQVQQLGKALGLTPEEIATYSRGAAEIRRLRDEVGRLGLAIGPEQQAALNSAAAAWNEFTSLLEAAGQRMSAAFAPAFTQLVETAKQVLTDIITAFATLPLDAAIAASINRAGLALADQLQSLTSIVLDAGIRLGAALAEALWNSFTSALVKIVTDIPSEIVTNLGILWQNLGRLGEIETAGIEAGKRFVGGIIQAIASAAGDIWNAIKSALGLAGGGQVGGGDTGLPMAGGGMIGGRGTGTSDSNLAWVSRGEHIMPARAVAQPGVLAFLEALRHSGGNLGRVLDGMGQFAMGGVVPQMQLRGAFADGGLVGGAGTRALHLHLPNGQTFGPFRGSESVLTSLERAAVHLQFSSTGRKPSWLR